MLTQKTAIDINIGNGGGAFEEKIKALFGELRGHLEVPAIPAPGDLGELSAGLEDVGDADGLPEVPGGIQLREN